MACKYPREPASIVSHGLARVRVAHFGAKILAGTSASDPRVNSCHALTRGSVSESQTLACGVTPSIVSMGFVASQFKAIEYFLTVRIAALFAKNHGFSYVQRYWGGCAPSIAAGSSWKEESTTLPTLQSPATPGPPCEFARRPISARRCTGSI